jgi:hypothetical protein
MALLCGLRTLIDPIVQPQAGVTLIPESTTVRATLPVTLILGTAKGSLPAHAAAVQGRQLPTLTLSQQTSVPTSGIGHQPAQAAHGLVTFSNALPLAQTIPAGTMLTGSDGTEIVTDQAALIPAGDGTTNGATTVPAHALVAGPSGDIGVLDINGPCCRAYVLAKNTSAFVGGQNARSYPMVQRTDIDGAASSLKTSLGASVQAALVAQVHPGETLLVPVPCTPSVERSQPAGAEAERITVTVEERCQGIAYQSSAMQHLVGNALQQQAGHTLGAPYAPMGAATISIASVKGTTGDVLHLEVQGTQSWVYQLSAGELAQLRAAIAGTTKAEAAARLLQAPGVRQVIFGDGVGERLPSDPDRIQVAVLYRV